MKKAKATKRKAGRPTGRRPVIAFRVDQSLYDQIHQAAGASTVAEETSRRIARSFQEDGAFGGPDMQRIGAMMTSTFWFAGQRAAAAKGEKNWAPAEWMQDQECYRTALVKVAEALIEGLPKPTQSEKALTIEQIKSRIASGLVRSGQLEFTDSSGKSMTPGFVERE